MVAAEISEEERKAFLRGLQYKARSLCNYSIVSESGMILRRPILILSSLLTVRVPPSVTNSRLSQRRVHGLLQRREIVACQHRVSPSLLLSAQRMIHYPQGLFRGTLAKKREQAAGSNHIVLMSTCANIQAAPSS